jgi:hypothetical protein
MVSSQILPLFLREAGMYYWNRRMMQQEYGIDLDVYAKRGDFLNKRIMNLFGLEKVFEQVYIKKYPESQVTLLEIYPCLNTLGFRLAYEEKNFPEARNFLTKEYTRIKTLLGNNDHSFADWVYSFGDTLHACKVVFSAGIDDENMCKSMVELLWKTCESKQYKTQDLELVQYLVKQGIQPNDNTLKWATKNTHNFKLANRDIANYITYTCGILIN